MLYLALALLGGTLHPAPQDTPVDLQAEEEGVLGEDDAIIPLATLQWFQGDDLRKRDIPAEKLQAGESGYLGWLLLEWGGGRQRLEDLGLAIEMLYTTDGSYALDGGADPQGTSLRGLLDLTLTYDTEPQLGVRGGLFHAGLQWINGSDGSQRFGVAQPFSNIDAEHRLQLGRLWYQQMIEQSGTIVRLGKIDGNSQFAYVESGGQFIHSSMGFSPTIYLMPTYPDAAFGMVVQQRVGHGFELRAGVLDGSAAQGVRTGEAGPQPLFEGSKDLFLIGEAVLSWDSKIPGRSAVGAWMHTGDLERFDGGVEDGTSGIYALIEQRLWSRGPTRVSHIDGFLQLGWADAAVSPFETHIGGGAQWVDAFEAETHILGLGVSHVGLSNAPGAGFSESTETAFELFYGFDLAPWIRAKPDLQYVVNPGGDAALADAWIATARLTFSL